MPPSKKIDREEIISEAIGLIREQGDGGLNARELAKKMGCSTQPIFSNFSGMDELRDLVIARAYGIYYGRLKAEMERGEYPPYKASGMAYVRFASEEKELFKLLFMRNRNGERLTETPDWRDASAIMQKNLGLSRERANKFHLEMWVTVHGIATMLATGFLVLSENEVSEILSDCYLGLKKRYEEE